MTRRTTITTYGNVGSDPGSRTNPSSQVTRQFYDQIADDLAER